MEEIKEELSKEDPGVVTILHICMILGFILILCFVNYQLYDIGSNFEHDCSVTYNLTTICNGDRRILEKGITLTSENIKNFTFKAIN
jgi:hypothetical protein